MKNRPLEGFINISQLLFFFYATALLRGFSIEKYNLDVNFANYLFLAIAIIGTIAIAIYHLERNRKYALSKVNKYIKESATEK